MIVTLNGNISGFDFTSNYLTIELYTLDGTEPAFIITVVENGSYTMSGIPAGEYILKAYAEGYEEYTEKVRLTKETINFDIKMKSNNPTVDRLLGDVNNDGEVGKSDYVQLKRFCFETVVLDEASLLAADVNQDGDVNKADYVHLKRFCFETMNISPEYIQVPVE